MKEDKIKLLEKLGFVEHKPVKSSINDERKRILNEDFIDVNEQILAYMLESRKNNTEK